MNKYLKELVKDPNIPVVLDYDGTLFEARWFVRHISIFDNSPEALKKAQEEDDCLYTEPIPYMRNFVSKIIRTKNVFCCSRIHTDIEFEYKTNAIHQYYPKISKLYWAKSLEDKIKQLQSILDTYGVFIYIDDNLEDLLVMERHFKHPEKCHFFHMSSIMV